MLKSFAWAPFRIEVFLLAWILIGGVGFADTLDLSDDLLLVVTGNQLAMETLPEDDLQENNPASVFSLIRTTTPPLFVVHSFVQANIPPPLPSLPRHQALHTYRI